MSGRLAGLAPTRSTTCGQAASNCPSSPLSWTVADGAGVDGAVLAGLISGLAGSFSSLAGSGSGVIDVVSGLAGAGVRGAASVADQARTELVAAGARPRRNRLTGPESLTASELRVARLAADGHTNREIAQALFVTRRTVEVHLTNAYRKLDIQSRDALPDALGSRPPPNGT